MINKIKRLFYAQLGEWQFAGQHYEDLKQVVLKEVVMNDGVVLKLQFNPARIRSTSAQTDAKSLAERPCFLCEKNRPKEQRGIELSEHFVALVNPFPILREHFTIVNTEHRPQQISEFWGDFLTISRQFGKEFSLFYNGAKCGASAPDHLHFQAGNTDQFPIWEQLFKANTQKLWQNETLAIYSFESDVNAILLQGNAIVELEEKLQQIFQFLSENQWCTESEEPMVNILAKYDNGWQILVFPRERHRPKQYFAEGEEQILLSPATVDFGSLVAVPRKVDFDRLDADLLQNIFNQLTCRATHFNQLKAKIQQL